MIYSKIKGVIFDLGSTLIEFEGRPWNEISLEGQQLGYDSLIESDHNLPDIETFNDRLEEIKSQYRACAVETLVEWRSLEAFERLIREIGLENPEIQARRCMDAFYGVVRKNLILLNGAVEMLAELKRRGYKTGLISNTIFPGADHEVDLDIFGLSQYIDFRIYSSDFGYRKPYPGIYAEGLKRIGLPADQTLFVGDRYIEDVEGPQKAGMMAVLKYHEGRVYPDPMPKDFEVIHEISELPGILDLKK